MRRTWLTTVFVLAILWGLAVGGNAEAQDTVRISAARSGWYHVEEQLFVGEGEVQIEAGDTFITGDYVEWRLQTEELLVSGSVVLRQGENELTGEHLVYSVAQGVGEFLDVEALVDVPKATSPVFLRTEKVTIAEGKYQMVNGRITTCDLDRPHFHLAVNEIEVRPDDKLIIKGVTYYEGSIPLFYWPYMVIPLDDRVSDFIMSLPVIGYSSTEGYYVKNAFDYYINDNAYGTINLDLYSKLGVGYGFKHNYSLGKFGSGKLGAYHIPFSENKKLSADFSHEWSSGPWRLVTTNSVEETNDKRTIDSRSRLSLSTATISANVQGSYRENPGTNQKKSWEYGGTWRQQLGQGLRLNLTGSVTGREGSTLVRMVNYLAETTYTRGNQTWGLAVEQEYNPDLLEEGAAPTWRSVNRMPELSWRLSNPRLASTSTPLPMRLEAVAGRYHEFPSDVEDWRVRGSMSLLTQYWRPTPSTTFSYSGDISTARYGGDNQQSVFSGKLNLTQNFGGGVRLTARYNEQMVWGASPFRFDKSSAIRTLNLQLNYSGGAFTASGSTSYNFLTGEYGAAALQGVWRPSGSLRLSVSAGYDINQGVWGRIVPLLEYTRKADGQDVTLRVGAMYRADRSEWERVEVQVKTPIGSTWAVTYDAVYEPYRQEFTRGQITVDKDFHCRSVTLAYDHVRNRIAFSLTINAFPSLPLGWDSDTGVSLFDIEDVFDLIGVDE